VTSPTPRSFGTRLIETSTTEKLQGVAALEYAPTGIVFEFHASVDSLTVVTGAVFSIPPTNDVDIAIAFHASFNNSRLETDKSIDSSMPGKPRVTHSSI
jgi:hypothetical protein